MPASATQISANRHNAQHSTGPRTESGKQRSSQNALRHGLTGRVVVLPTEDLAVYQAFAKELVDSLSPKTPLERQLAQTIADTQWRLNRARSLEDGMFALGHSEEAGNIDTGHPEIHAALTAARVFRADPRAFVNLSLYEQRLHRAQKVALEQLQKLQAERKALYEKEMAEARLLRNLDNMKGLAYEPARDGFVYASAEIDAAATRSRRREEANLAGFCEYDLEKFQARAASLAP